MTTDPYTDAINAGAAALVKPYRDPDTVEAFVETFPTIASARVIEAALPHLRASILAEQAGPGPCPATEPIPALSPNGPQNLVALCDLRAGHAGQHEAEDAEGGHFRWSDNMPQAGGCSSVVTITHDEDNAAMPVQYIGCERTYQHIGYHVAGTYVWNNGGTVVAR